MYKHIDENIKSKGGRPLVVGVTGGIGSGKTLVCRRLQENGAAVLSADELARLAVMPGTRAYRQIIEHFGEQVVLPDKGIDRQALRNIISSSGEARRTLEAFVHPEVFRLLAERIDDAARAGEIVVFVEVPLLFEAGIEDWFDFVLVVSAERETRIARIESRDSVTRGHAEAMIKMQMPEDEKKKRADFVIDNNDTPETTLARVDRMYENVVQLSGKRHEKS